MVNDPLVDSCRTSIDKDLFWYCSSQQSSEAGSNFCQGMNISFLKFELMNQSDEVIFCLQSPYLSAVWIYSNLLTIQLSYFQNFHYKRYFLYKDRVRKLLPFVISDKIQNQFWMTKLWSGQKFLKPWLQTWTNFDIIIFITQHQPSCR